MQNPFVSIISTVSTQQRAEKRERTYFQCIFHELGKFEIVQSGSYGSELAVRASSWQANQPQRQGKGGRMGVGFEETKVTRLPVPGDPSPTNSMVIEARQPSLADPVEKKKK